MAEPAKKYQDYGDYNPDQNAFLSGNKSGLSVHDRNSEQKEELLPEEEKQKRDEFYENRLQSKSNAISGNLNQALTNQDSDSESSSEEPTDSDTDVSGKANQDRVSKRLLELRKRRRQLYKQASGGQVSGGSTTLKKNVRRYKRIKNFIRAIKIASIAGTSLGDVFVSLSILFLSINGEWLYSKWNKDYPFDVLDKFMLIVGWFIILAVIGMATAIILLVLYLVEESGLGGVLQSLVN